MSGPRSIAEIAAASDPMLPHLLERMTASRLARFETALRSRTRRVAVVLEGLRQEHNYSAVMRSCDALGVQDVHLLDSDETFSVNREVALGSQKWLTITRHSDGPAECFDKLRADGYRIVATSPHEPFTPLSQLDLNQPVALLLGNELEGLPPKLLDAADERIAIPMVGLVESFNVSVAAAICLYDITRRLRLAGGWELSDIELAELLSLWTRRSIKNIEAIEAEIARRLAHQAAEG